MFKDFCVEAADKTSQTLKNLSGNSRNKIEHFGNSGIYEELSECSANTWPYTKRWE